MYNIPSCTAELFYEDIGTPAVQHGELELYSVGDIEQVEFVVQ